NAHQAQELQQADIGGVVDLWYSVPYGREIGLDPRTVPKDSMGPWPAIRGVGVEPSNEALCTELSKVAIDVACTGKRHLGRFGNECTAELPTGSDIERKRRCIGRGSIAPERARAWIQFSGEWRRLSHDVPVPLGLLCTDARERVAAYGI